nr:MAG TPA: hypothetical protein [Caudoviricetes sp.]
MRSLYHFYKGDTILFPPYLIKRLIFHPYFPLTI